MYSLLLRTPTLSVSNYACRAPRRAPQPVETSETWDLSFVRRGMFVIRSGSQERLGTPAQMLFFRPGDPFRAEHPHDGGDDCTVFSLTHEGFDTLASSLGSEARAAFARGSAAADPEAFLQHARLFHSLKGNGEPLRLEETAWSIAGSAIAGAATIVPREGTDAVLRRQRRVVRQAVEILSTRYSEHVSLTTVARAARTSPFHLTRLFRAHTGMPLHRYLKTLRLRIAVDRLAAGENDLTTLALDVGFSDHSHFTNAFRREFGIAPSRFRASFR